MSPIIEQARTKLSELVKEHNLGEHPLEIIVKTLTPRQAIGNPKRQDYPILIGKEVIVEAQFDESYGQAFTDQPQSFSGTIDEVLQLDLNTNGRRAIFLASLNAIALNLGLAKGVRHCKNEEPEECARQIAADFNKRFANQKIGLIGLQPAMLENLSSSFGPDRVRCTDLNPANIGNLKFGIEIWDGATATNKLIECSDVLLVSSSTLSNGSFDAIHQLATSAAKPFILYGITGAGVCALLGMERVCHFGH